MLASKLTTLSVAQSQKFVDILLFWYLYRDDPRREDEAGPRQLNTNEAKIT